MDRISDSGSDDLGSIPNGGTMIGTSENKILKALTDAPAEAVRAFPLFPFEKPDRALPVRGLELSFNCSWGVTPCRSAARLPIWTEYWC